MMVGVNYKRPDKQLRICQSERCERVDPLGLHSYMLRQKIDKEVTSATRGG